MIYVFEGISDSDKTALLIEVRNLRVNCDRYVSFFARASEKLFMIINPFDAAEYKKDRFIETEISRAQE